MPSKDAPSVKYALQSIFSEYQKESQTIFRSITADNGSEFSELAKQGEENQIDVYFAHPYASWERGTNERHNGLIRRFIKKGQPIHTYPDEQIDEVEEWMNTLPRKILSYQTPDEAFAQFIDSVA
jgi:IS30 family transposase